MDLEEFVSAQYGSLLRVAYLLTGDRHDREDLLHDALVRSWAYASRSRIEQPGAFIRRSMVNLYISQGRRRRLVREDPHDHESLPAQLSSDRSSEVVQPTRCWVHFALFRDTSGRSSCFGSTRI